MDKKRLTIDDVLQRAFDYSETLKRINRSEDEISKLRQLVKEDEWLPKCVSDKHVSHRFLSQLLTFK